MFLFCTVCRWKEQRGLLLALMCRSDLLFCCHVKQKAGRTDEVKMPSRMQILKTDYIETEAGEMDGYKEERH